MMSKLLKYLANLPRFVKGLLLFCFDAAILGFSMLLAFAVRFDPDTIDYHYNVFSDGAWLGYCFIIKQHPGMVMTKLRRLFNRARPEEAEMNILRGILTSINKSIK